MRGAPKGPAVLRALHTINSYPFHLHHPVFARYPAMKFGEREAVEHFARLLEPAARSLGGDILTAPPVHGLPSGANLICEALARRLGMETEVLRLFDAPGAFESEAEFAQAGDYARLDYATRQAEQEPDAVFDAAKFRGKSVVFVNDINVTGSQQERMMRLLAPARPRAVHWLLIVDVAPGVGRRFPHLESEINHSRLADRDELIAFLRLAELTYTGKFVARLLSYGIESWTRICRSLDRATRSAIREAILAEGVYPEAIFGEKLALL